MDAPVDCGIRIQKEIIDDIQTGVSETVTQHTTQLQEVHKIKTLKCKHTIMAYGTDDPSIVKLVSLVSSETGERCKISEPSKSVEPNEIVKLVSSVATEYR